MRKLFILYGKNQVARLPLLTLIVSVSYFGQNELTDTLLSVFLALLGHQGALFGLFWRRLGAIWEPGVPLVLPFGSLWDHVWPSWSLFKGPADC